MESKEEQNKEAFSNLPVHKRRNCGNCFWFRDVPREIARWQSQKGVCAYFEFDDSLQWRVHRSTYRDCKEFHSKKAIMSLARTPLKS